MNLIGFDIARSRRETGLPRGLARRLSAKDCHCILIAFAKWVHCIRIAFSMAAGSAARPRTTGRHCIFIVFSMNG
jgi:hypothetical protein